MSESEEQAHAAEVVDELSAKIDLEFHLTQLFLNPDTDGNDTQLTIELPANENGNEYRVAVDTIHNLMDVVMTYASMRDAVMSHEAYLMRGSGLADFINIMLGNDEE